MSVSVNCKIAALSAVLALRLVFAASPVAATIFDWDTVPGTVGPGDGSITGGAGTWDTTVTNGNWTSDGGATNTFWPSTGADNDAVFGGTSGAVTILGGVAANDITFNTFNYILSGASTLTLNGATPTITVNPGGPPVTIGNNTATDIAGSAGLVKDGAGTLVLSGSVVNSLTGGIRVKQGLLTLNYANLGTPTDSVDSSNTLTLDGGTLGMTGKNGVASSQTFNGVTLSSDGGITATSVGGSGSMNVSLGSITRPSRGTVTFILPANGAITTTNTNEAATILGGWATINNNDWATVSGCSIVTYTGYETSLNPADWGPGENASFNNDPTANVTSDTTINSLRVLQGGGTKTLTIDAGQILTLTSGGLLVNTPSGGQTTTIAGGTLRGSASGELIVRNTGASGLVINSVIADNGGATGLTKSGTSSLTLGGANTYSGVTTLNAGTLIAGDFGDGSQASSTLGTSSSAAANLVLNGGTLSGTGSTDRLFTLGTGGVAFSSGNFNFTNLGAIAFSGFGPRTLSFGTGGGGQNHILSPILGDGPGGATSVIVRTGALVTLNGANTYSGGTEVQGILQISSDSNLGAVPGSFQPANITQSGTLKATADLTVHANRGITVSGALPGFDSKAGDTLTVAGAISGTPTLVRIAGTTGATVELAGDSTFDAPIEIFRGTLITSSLNSVVGGSATSNLGAPSSAGNGTITFGSAATGATSGTLVYTGVGETTDRILSVGGAAFTLAATLDQSGTGLLKFTSNLSFTGASKTLTLQGSTAGTGEFAGNIGNGTSGNTPLIKNGTGQWTVSGTNTYTGKTTVSGGTLQFAKQLSLYNNTPASWITTNLDFQSGSTAAFNVGGAGEFTAGDIDTLKALGTATGGFRNGSSIGFDTTNAAGGEFTYNSVIANTNAGANEIGLVKLGSNTLTLGGVSGYTGETFVEAGSLKITGSIAASSQITVANGATLTGDGAVGDLVLNGTISPGLSPGTMLAGNTTWIDGGDFLFEINDVNAGAGGDPGWDLLDINGSLDLTNLTVGGFEIDITSLTLANLAGDVHDFDETQDYTWDFVHTTGGVSGFDPLDFVLDASAFSNNIGSGAFGIQEIGNNLEITFTAGATDNTVPEPASLLIWLLAEALCAGIVLRQHWRARIRISTICR